MISRYLDRLLGGVDRWFFLKVSIKSKLRRFRCVLLGGHIHEWTPLLGSGRGQEALICKRCFCHVLAYRPTEKTSEEASCEDEGCPHYGTPHDHTKGS